MTRAQLAEQLRQKLQERGGFSSGALAGFDYDFLVNAYLNTACKDCGKKLAECVDVEQVLAESRDLDHFFDLCVDAKDHALGVAYYDWPTEIDFEDVEEIEAK